MLGISLTTLAIGTGSSGSLRQWGGWNVSAGFAQSPANTFTRNTADSWTPRVYSNSAFSGPVNMTGTPISGADRSFGLDSNRAVSLPYESLYGWYMTGSAVTRSGASVRVSFGAINAGDIFGVRKFWNGTDWTIEWYRVRAGTTAVADSLTTASDATLGVLAGAFQNAASFSLSPASG